MSETYHCKISIFLNSLVPGTYDSDLKLILALIMKTTTLGTRCDITPM